MSLAHEDAVVAVLAVGELAWSTYRTHKICAHSIHRPIIHAWCMLLYIVAISIDRFVEPYIFHFLQYGKLNLKE